MALTKARLQKHDLPVYSKNLKLERNADNFVCEIWG